MEKDNDKIKSTLEAIKRRIASEPKSDIFEFSFEELIPDKAKPIPGLDISEMATDSERLSLQHILQRIQKENSGIEFTFPDSAQKQKSTLGLSQLQIRELCKPTFYVHINDHKKFEEYYKKIAISSTDIHLTLNNKGELCVEKDGKKTLTYSMEWGGQRYKIVYLLATRKEWIPTKYLAEEFNTTPEKIRKAIEQIKRLMEKFLKISGDKIIENKKGLGYKITKIKVIRN
ncbi:MAG: HTH domain-containing protein [Candidatus Paceibacterota bacterium]|jgi:hypothetical protein